MTTNPTTPDHAALREAFRVELAVLDVPWPSHKRALEALDRALDATPAPEAPTGRTADVLRELRAEVLAYRPGSLTFDPATASMFRQAFLAAIDARLTAQPEPSARRVRHGRHCPCSACAREDWTNPDLAPCDVHPGVRCAYDGRQPEPSAPEGLDVAVVERVLHEQMARTDLDVPYLTLREAAVLAPEFVRAYREATR